MTPLFASDHLIDAAGSRPHIIMVHVDDMGFGDLSLYGREDLETPRLDALAAAGATLTAGYAPHPSCIPSRAGYMTGAYPHRFHVHGNHSGHITGKAVTIPERLAEAGYRSAHIGKWHLGGEDHQLPLAQGFDYASDVTHIHQPDDLIPVASSERSRWLDLDGTMPQDLGLTAYDDLTEQGEPVIRANQTLHLLADLLNKSDEPIFISLGIRHPHKDNGGPIATPRELGKRLENVNENIRTYVAMIYLIDCGMGRLVDGLAALGIEDNTLIVFYSDNGALNKGRDHVIPKKPDLSAANSGRNLPYSGGKWNVWEGGIRVSFILHWPQAIPAGTVLTDPVAALDLTPTFLTLAGHQTTLKQPMDGIDITEYMTGKTASLPPRKLFFSFGSGRIGGSGSMQLSMDPGSLSPIESILTSIIPPSIPVKKTTSHRQNLNEQQQCCAPIRTGKQRFMITTTTSLVAPQPRLSTR